MTDIRFIEAKFATQEQAESVVRKLASLRGDRFRIAREPPFDAAEQRSAAHVEFAEEGDMGVSAPHGDAESPFTLSVRVPEISAEQAYKVIRAAGGQLR